MIGGEGDTLFFFDCCFDFFEIEFSDSVVISF